MKTILPTSSIASVARSEELNESTVRGWVNKLPELKVYSAQSEKKEKAKAMHHDKVPTITIGLLAFCRQARSLRPPLPLTIDTIFTKAQELKNKLLERLEVDEAALENVTANELDNIFKHKFSKT
jgi:hypothetical protein